MYTVCSLLASALKYKLPLVTKDIRQCRSHHHQLRLIATVFCGNSIMANEDAQQHLPKLGSGASDRIAAALRGVAGVVPVVGSALAEIVTEIVPNQRLDRIETYLKLLGEEVSALDMYDASERMKRPDNVDLIEDGARQAARALTDERKRFIARAVAAGISADDRDKINEKRILGLLGELDDEEVLLLDAYNSNDHEKFRRLRPEPAFIGSPADVIDRDALYEAAGTKLERLSLLEQKVRLDSKTKLPEFDTFTGRPKGYRQITRLGRLVLHRIGLSGP